MEQLAVMKGVNVGMRDCNAPVMWFETEGLNGSALQVLPWDEAERLIRNAGVYRLSDLEGKLCIVDVDRGFMKFVKIKK